jgi:two-component system, OmpR family, sensor histidine kinase MtrB
VSAGVRRRAAVTFALGGVLVATVVAGSTYVVARSYLTAAREHGAVRQADVDARIALDALRTAGTSKADVLSQVAPPASTTVLLERRGRWSSSSLDIGPDDLPAQLREMPATAGSATVMWTQLQGEPSLVVSIPLPQVGAVFHEAVNLTELTTTLDTLRGVLLIVAATTALAAAALGRWAAGRAVRPLDEVAVTATRIAGGQLDTRLAATDDPDLAAIVGSFNDMVDALAARIEREARFTADVTHELRSPLTTLVAAVDLVEARADQLPQRVRPAVSLAVTELARFRRLLDDLVELARLDAGVADAARELVDLRELVAQALTGSGRDGRLLAVEPPEPVPVCAHKRQVERALVNLFENADRHGRGLTRVAVECTDTDGIVIVDDEGPGIPAADRERVFERFARGDGGSRGAQPGTGLGLSLVTETLRAHEGAAWCADAPGGGARLVLRLPLEPADEEGP